MSTPHTVDRQALIARLESLPHHVTLLFFSQTIGAPDSVHVTRQILHDLAGLSDRISVEEVSFVLDKDRVAAYGVADIPAIVPLRDGEDTRIRLLGAPSGYETASLFEAVLLAGTRASGLSDESRELIHERVQAPLDIRVFVTPTCVYCPRAVMLAFQMATEHPLIRATSIDASELFELSRRYRVTGVPKTVVNDATEIMGALPERDFIRAVLGVVDEPVGESPGAEGGSH